MWANTTPLLEITCHIAGAMTPKTGASRVAALSHSRWHSQQRSANGSTLSRAVGILRPQSAQRP